MSRLRPFQKSIQFEVFAHWNGGRRNVLVKSATGSGKTVITADTVRQVNLPASVIAHRSELVTQISTALAREGVAHRIVGADATRRDCVALHMDALGRSYFDPTARVGVCSVDTLVGKDAKSDPWFAQVGLWVMDEAHHVLRSNKWGKAVEMFPNARGLGVTATPARADGEGLGRHADGVFDEMVEGPQMRDLIRAGYLTDYRVFAPPSDVDYSEVTVTAQGDYSPAKLRAAVHASDTIVGDVVRQYLAIARGKLGVTFAVDVEAAQQLAQAFRAAGVPAEVVSAKTPALLRAQILKRFARREVLQLVNVDLFGEGFDLPAIEVVSMVRKTESWPLYVQQFGRALRLMISPELSRVWGDLSDEERLAHIARSGKPRAIIIDHVGNVIRHGLPDAPRIDSLDRRERRSNGPSDAIPLRVCANPVGCLNAYPRFMRCCPECGFYPEPPARNDPQFVDGDLFELDEATLAALRGEVDRIDGAARIPYGLDGLAAAGVQKRHFERQQAQGRLRHAIALWAGWEGVQGYSQQESYRRFYHAFGLDVLTAQALGRPEAEALTAKIQTVLDRHGVIAA